MPPADQPALGYPGTGIMGAPMARNRLRAGYPVVVHNRTRHKTGALAADGAANSEVLRLRAEKVLSGDFTSGGGSGAQLKDLNSIHDSMAVLGMSLPVTDLMHDLYRQLAAAGLGDEDHSAIIRRFERRTDGEARV